MTTLDVIRGLECCQADGDGDLEHCEECPYNSISMVVQECRTQLSRDALALIRPRVLTLEEAYDADIVWYESRTVYSSGYGRLIPGDTRVSTVVRRTEEGNAYEDDREYGSVWRCWSRKPTMAERKAVRWK